jgi:CubicO group peptidase (beta-lactamase class C family)
MTRLRLIGCAWLMVACGAAGNEAERIAAEADVYLRAKTQAGAFSGTVLLARGGKVLFVKGYGFANEEWRIPNDADTRFPIASVTKTFTAALVMKLLQQGRLALEDPLCKFLAPCPESWRAITLRHLLLQTTGIPDYARDRDFIAKVRQRQSLPELIGVFRDRPLEFTPGARHAYSNSNYILLGAVLEKASGRSYEALLREHIFEPLGMRHSGLDDTSLVLAKRASGYSPSGKGRVHAQFVDSSWLYAAGGIYSTVGDLLLWERALQSGSVLPKEEIAQMWSPEHGSYGFGWQLLAPSPEWLNRRVVFHAGGITGFASDLLIYPDEKVTVVVLANLLPIPLADIARDLSAIALR